MADDRDTGVCGAEVPPLIDSILTGTGLTLDQAVAAIERGETPALTGVQRRIVDEHAVTQPRLTFAGGRARNQPA